MFEAGNVDILLRVVREGLLLVLIVSAPPLLVSVASGILTGVVQAATQIQDQTLGFVPKLVAVVICIVAVGPLLGAQVVRFTQAVLAAVPGIR